MKISNKARCSVPSLGHGIRWTRYSQKFAYFQLWQLKTKAKVFDGCGCFYRVDLLHANKNHTHTFLAKSLVWNFMCGIKTTQLNPHRCFRSNGLCGIYRVESKPHNYIHTLSRPETSLPIVLAHPGNGWQKVNFAFRRKWNRAPDKSGQGLLRQIIKVGVERGTRELSFEPATLNYLFINPPVWRSVPTGRAAIWLRFNRDLLWSTMAVSSW